MYNGKELVEPQWLEYLWDHGNLFEIEIIRATEGKSCRQVRMQMTIIEGNLLDLQNNGMLSVLIRLASMRQF